MMHKKDYIKFSELFAKRMNESIEDSPNSWTAICFIKDDIVELFKQDNPNFDADRFNAYIEKRITELSH